MEALSIYINPRLPVFNFNPAGNGKHLNGSKNICITTTRYNESIYTQVNIPVKLRDSNLVNEYGFIHIWTEHFYSQILGNNKERTYVLGKVTGNVNGGKCGKCTGLTKKPTVDTLKRKNFACDIGGYYMLKAIPDGMSTMYNTIRGGETARGSTAWR